MKRVLGLRAICLAAAVIAAGFAGGSSADAAFVFKMRITIDGVSEIITDNDGVDSVDASTASDQSAVVDEIVYEGTFGDIKVTLNSAESEIDDGFPSLTISVSSEATGDPGSYPSTLRIEIVDSDLSPGADFAIVSGTNLASSDNSLVVTGFVDDLNQHKFATGPVGFTPPIAPSSAFTGFAPVAVTDPFSLGLQVDISYAKPGDDADFQANIRLFDDPIGGPLVPEPASLAVWGGLSVLGLVFGRRFAKKSA